MGRTIDEAIAHAREVAKDNRSICTVTDKGCDKFSKCLQCAEEHEQLAEWLEELKELKEKNTEKKVKVWANGEEHCPCCDKNLSSLGFFKHCIDCGQKLDWSE